MSSFGCINLSCFFPSFSLKNFVVTETLLSTSETTLLTEETAKREQQIAPILNLLIVQSKLAWRSVNTKQFILNTLPVQITLEDEPVFVYPVLQVHCGAFVTASCEQIAFESHPPLFTLQLSANVIQNTL